MRGKNYILLLPIFLAGLIIWLSFNRHSTLPGVIFNPTQVYELDSMPILQSHVLSLYGTGRRPIANRTPEIRRFLSSAIKIVTKKTIGSGTIVYYDDKSGYAYVQSCAHLWNGNFSRKKGEQDCQIEVWYHNQEKLSSKETYRGEVLYYSNTEGEDLSLIRFKPNWIPKVCLIGVPTYEIRTGTRLHSTGCDGDAEPAEYSVLSIGMEKGDMITTENSPRPGRSGGGLIGEDGSLVGVCRATSEEDGTGIGVFVPLETIRDVNERQGYGWLNEISSKLVRQIPIIDHNRRQDLKSDYIPLPTR